MEFFNNNQNKNEKKSVNTTGVQFYNNESILFPSTLIVGGWNTMLTLKIHPAKDKTQQSSSSIYDYEKNVQCALTGEQAFLLAKAIKEKVIPSIGGNENITVGVTVGTNNMVVISNGVGKKCNPFLAIYRNINNNFEPEVKIYYEFNCGDIIANYEEVKSENIRKETVPHELMYFGEILMEYAKSFGNATYHSIRYQDRYYREKQVEVSKALANNLGISSSNNGYQRRQNNSPFNSVPAQQEASVENVSSMDSLDSFLN